MSNQGHSVRINKAISATGFCSRREADELISQERVTINGKVASLNSVVCEEDEVKVDGERLKVQARRLYLLVNKQTGVNYSNEEGARKSIFEEVSSMGKMMTIGVFERSNEGLVLLTNDGGFAKKLIESRAYIEQEYIIKVEKALSNIEIEKLKRGFSIMGKRTPSCFVETLGKLSYRVVVKAPLDFSLRKVLLVLVGKSILSIKRVRLINLNLTLLKESAVKILTQKELTDFNTYLNRAGKELKVDKIQKRRTLGSSKQGDSRSFTKGKHKKKRASGGRTVNQSGGYKKK